MQYGNARRLWLGAVLTALALGALALGTLASSASALALDNTTDTSTTIDSDVHWWNSTPVMTSGNYQIMVYWGAENARNRNYAPLRVARRKISDGTVERVDFGGTYDLKDPLDGHNTVRSGLSPVDGRIHISWTIHNDPHQYIISSASCITQTRLSSCTWTRLERQAEEAEIGSMTYPIYFNDLNGNLFMTYREGSSVRGDQYLNRYNNDGTWTAVGKIMRGRSGGSYDPDGAGPIRATTNRGVYVWGFKFDKTGRLHAMWNWREESTEFSSLAAQHDAEYAYSDDNGTTWYNNAGTRIATANSEPIVVTDPGLTVVEYPYDSYVVDYQMELDSHNQPHVVLPVSDAIVPDLTDGNVRQQHLWRTVEGTWYALWIEPAGGHSQTFGYGDIMFDRADDLYYIYGKDNLGWYGWDSDIFHEEDLRQDHVTWQGGDHVNIQQMSVNTSLITDDYVNTPVSTTGNKQVRVRMRNNTEGTTANIAWITDESKTWAGARSQSFTISARDTVYHEYTFTITDADWNGNLRLLSFEPIVGTRADAGDEIDIDYIRITNSAGTVAKAWEFNEGATVLEAEASPTNNWATWSLNTLLPGYSDVRGDADFTIDNQRYAEGRGDEKKVDFNALEQGSALRESLALHEFDITGDTVSKFWNFDVDLQGWRTNGDISNLRWESDGGANAMAGTITGNESRLYSLDLLGVYNDGDANILHVRMKNETRATTARVWFVTNADATFDMTKSKTFTITARSGYTEYTIDMSRVSGWERQTLRRLRIDPSEDAGVTGDFKISRVYIDRT